MAPGTRPRAGRWGWIQAQAAQADDSNGLVTWNHLRKRRQSPTRLLWSPTYAFSTAEQASNPDRDGNGTATSLVRACVEPSAGIEPATPSLPFVWPRTCNKAPAGQWTVSVRGCPLGTVGVRPMWHAGGTADRCRTSLRGLFTSLAGMAKMRG